MLWALNLDIHGRLICESKTMKDLTKRKRKKRKETLPGLKNKTWNLFSRIVRIIHSNYQGQCKCVTCGRWYPWIELDAGHFVAKNRGGALWFDCHNVHPQCRHCNRYLRGNLIAYTRYMVEHYGMDEVERLEKLAGPFKRTRADYQELIDHYTQCAMELGIK